MNFLSQALHPFSVTNLRRKLSAVAMVLSIASSLLVSPAMAADTSSSGKSLLFTPPALRHVAASEKPWPANHFITLSYHDVNDQSSDQRYVAVRTDQLVEQFNWLHENGYKPVSVEQILTAKKGGPPLPEKATLLTFDDGFSSFYRRVLPILRAYNWPAVLAPVGSWMDVPDDQPVDFGGLMTPRSQMATWAQIKAISESGLVEIGAHTQNMHKGVTANPAGSMQPEAATHEYDVKTQQYESDAVFKERAQKDIAAITEKIRKVTGKAPRVWVWPYGAAQAQTRDEAQKQGYEMFLTLDSGLGDVQHLEYVPRVLIAEGPNLPQFAGLITRVQGQDIQRVAHIDLDYVYSQDPEEINRNLDVLIQRIAELRITTVYLQAFADPSGGGTVSEVYFPNRWLPMRADLFGRVAWQLRTRAGVEVFAWMPVLAYDFGKPLPLVQSWSPESGQLSVVKNQYQRLSPFDAEVRQKIGDVYEDLAKFTNFAGILFHDDALLSDFEDVGPAAMAAYAAQGLPNTPQALRADPETLQRWTRFKSRYLIDFTKELTERVKSIRGTQIETARNIYAQPILQPESEAWYAQNLDDFLETYTWTAPMAMPLMENISTKDSQAWLNRLVDAVAKRPGALRRTTFELQTKDWRQKPEATPIPDAQLRAWMLGLQARGALSYGYYPDDFLTNHPDKKMLRSTLSNYWFIQP